MIAFAVFLTSLVLLGGALALRARAPVSPGGRPAPDPIRRMPDEDLLPAAGPTGADGLAAFYGYQMRAGKFGRT